MQTTDFKLQCCVNKIGKYRDEQNCSSIVTNIPFCFRMLLTRDYACVGAGNTWETSVHFHFAVNLKLLLKKKKPTLGCAKNFVKVKYIHPLSPALF